MNKVIPWGTEIPAKKSQFFTIYQKSIKSNSISVYEGERTLDKNNYNNNLCKLDMS
jgi:molecular chaperone DnaK (HSP70)